MAAGAAGCGGDSGSETKGNGGVNVSTDTKNKPTVTFTGDAEKPSGLQVTDIVEGSGDAAKIGDSVAVQYVGISWSTQKQFDSSWDRGAQPFTVAPLGQARVIDGWNQGLVGAKVGGRRLIVIPPNLGYGAQGAGGVIGPNETLVFVVDVVSINA
ncbi:MAG: FKBP-type peptidyl-prolyl cis-trans isomerase [Hamadaea sp.]|nr:FKBP-type peptidyl-prolyl cis-trans isomerase [Hamadaea sp.]NUR49466.1 FKBP-type peptidyl-prolyl cis-trans isomerase [Hamadaea sp.]NUT02695.1 FKBP-type peptidyl-prolyl cis-trans isomerase [Hamadaea sp.]